MSGEAGPSRLAGQQIVGWAALLFILAVGVLGGGGSSSLPLPDAACQLAGFLMIGLLIATGRKGEIDRAALPMLALALLAFALPMAQLVPLPATFVDSLPGRELAGAIRAEAGATVSAPFSLDPDRTLLVALSLIPGIAMFAATLRCGIEWRRRLVIAWALVAGLAVFVGALQVASGGTVAEIYDTAHRQAATGFFANRNHEAVFLVVALILFAACFWARDASRSITANQMRAAFALLLVAGIFTTTSRAGILLFVLSLPVMAILVFGRIHQWRPGWRGLAIVGAVIAVVALLLVLNPVARGVIARFSFADDARWQFWPDVLYTLGQTWPAGSGIGTFPAVFATQERLDVLDELYVNHAHNDFLELAIEGGIIAVAMMAAFAVLLVLRVRACSAWHGDARRLALTGAFGILLVLLHSLIDYPLRAITITALFGFLVGLMFRPAAQVANPETN